MELRCELRPRIISAYLRILEAKHDDDDGGTTSLTFLPQNPQNYFSH